MDLPGTCQILPDPGSKTGFFAGTTITLFFYATVPGG